MKHKQAFDIGKGSIASAVAPAFLVYFALLFLFTDASSTTIEVIFEQNDAGIRKCMEFFSGKYNETEERYSNYGRKQLVIFVALKYIKGIVKGRHTTILTDQRPLIYIAGECYSMPLPKQQGRLDFILQFNVSIQYVKDEDNIAADALFRFATISTPSTLDTASIREA